MMKKLLNFMFVLSLCLGGCQVKPNYNETVEKFIGYYYGVTPKMINEIVDYYTPPQEISDKGGTFIDLDELEFFKMQEVCEIELVLGFMSSRAHSLQVKEMTKKEMDYLEIKETSITEDYESDDYLYFIHETTFTIHYLDGSTREDSAIGRVSVDKKTNLVHTYDERKTLDFVEESLN